MQIKLIYIATKQSTFGNIHTITEHGNKLEEAICEKSANYNGS